MSLSKNNLIKIALLITLILLASLFLTLDLNKVFEILKTIKLPFLFVALTTLFVELVLKALRLKILIAAHTKSSFLNNLIITLVGLPFGTVTPGRVGDLVKVYTLSKKTSLSKIKGLAIGVIEKIIDFFSLFILALVGIGALIIKGRINPVFLFLLFFILLMAMLIFFFLNKKYAEKILKIIYAKMIPSKYKNQLQCNFDDFYFGLSIILRKKTLLIVPVGLAFLLWFNRILRIFILALALSLKIKFIYFFLFMPIIEVVGIMPITIMGLGTREYIYIFLFSLIGISKEASVALSLLIFSTVIIPLSILGYFIALKEHATLR